MNAFRFAAGTWEDVLALGRGSGNPGSAPVKWGHRGRLAAMRHIYRITYPNGKIYVGMDLTGTALYFGSPRKDFIAADLGSDACRDLTIRKEILWESANAPESEVRAMERHFIESTGANNPEVGYNTWPRFTPPHP